MLLCILKPMETVQIQSPDQLAPLVFEAPQGRPMKENNRGVKVCCALTSLLYLSASINQAT